MPDSPAPSLDEAITSWRAELAASAGRDTLLDYQDLPTGTLDLATAHPSGLAQFLAGRPTRLSSLFREPAALSAARRRARAIRLAAAALADQYGVGGSFLATGMVSWRLSDDRTVTAPVLLRPLTLRPRGGGQADDDLDLSGQLRLNPALLRLLAEHGVALDVAQVLAVAGDPGSSPRAALAALTDATGALTDFTVSDRTVIGIFTDVVPALLADFDDLSTRLAEHPVVSALAGGPPVSGAVPGEVPRSVAFQVLDLDPDQRRVLRAVGQGASLRVTAPAGTGATRLLTQLVASQAGRGRRTLLVATQRAEVAGVVASLRSLGLGDLVADPADLLGNAAGAASIGEPGRAPGEPAPPGAADGSAAAGVLRSLADQRSALHRVREPWGVSVAQTLTALTRLSAGPDGPRTTVRLDRAGAAALAGGRRAEAARLLREAAELGAFEAGVQKGAWFGADLNGEDQALRALEAASRLASDTLPALRTEMARLASVAGLSGAASVTEWGRQLDLLVAVRKTLDIFTSTVYERSVADMVAATASPSWREERGIRMSALERRRWRRQARDLLRPGAHQPDLHGALLHAQAERLEWQRMSTGGGWPAVPPGLAAVDASYQAVLADLAVLDRALATTAGGAGLTDAPLEQLTARLEALTADAKMTAVLPRRAAAMTALRDLGLAGLLADLGERGVPADRVGDELELCWWTTVLEQALQERPLTETVAAGYLRAQRQAWSAAAAVVRDTEASAAQPSCTVVSPLALPQVVSAEHRFDLVVLAGASACGVAEGVLAMARGAQVLVVGDPGGLPPAGLDLIPTTQETGNEPAPPVRTSVLEATATALPTVSLTHQHRMPAQLAAAVLPEAGWSVPAPEHGLRLELVEDGTGRPDADGAVESVDAEVQRVVRLVIEHACRHPDRSLAVLTVTRQHARRVADAVRAELPEHPGAKAFFTRPSDEPFVVTDLSRSQDAVRDAVLLSVGFGRTTHGRVLHRFGPLDEAAGERGLTVAASRARRWLTVVSCLGVDDVDPERLKTEGARALRTLLARVAPPPRDHATLPRGAKLHDHDRGGRGGVLAPLLDDLADRLRHNGFDVESGDGRAGWPDLAVRRNGGRPVAVLTDARWVPDAKPDEVADLVEDDLAVASHLRRFGWQVVATSSLDLFTDPAAVVASVRTASGVRSAPAWETGTP